MWLFTENGPSTCLYTSYASLALRKYFAKELKTLKQSIPSSASGYTTKFDCLTAAITRYAA